MQKLFFIILVTIYVTFITGCSNKNSSVTVTHTKVENKKVENKKTIYQEKSKTIKDHILTQRGVIKGEIQSIAYLPEGHWLYFVKGENTVNGKLPQARFIYSKRLGNKGDKLYAIIKNTRAVEIYLTAKANIEKKPAQVKKSTKLKKRTKSRKTPWIDVPSEERIDLD